MTNKSEIGKLGEDLACKYLEQKGFQIIERNFRKPWGEIDIISQDKNGALVFVEVKTMRQYGNAAIAALNPEENITKQKLEKIKRISYLYANANPELINNEIGWRVDAITISVNNLPLEYKVNHFENI